MRKTNTAKSLLMLILCGFIIISCSESQQPSENSPINPPTAEDKIKHGEYLVTIMGCNDCHSPKRMGPNGPEIIPELMLSGYPSDRPVMEFKDPMIK